MTALDDRAEIQQAAAWISSARALVLLAGAGMGVDSGLPDFRGNEGFWRAYPAMEKLGIRFTDMANPEWFVRDPTLAWGFYGHRLMLYRATEPHEGFGILRRWNDDRFIFTSNVDGHFQRSGFAEEEVLECHGSLNYLQCREPCCGELWPADDLHLDVDEESFRAAEPLPNCPRCGTTARPNVLMFGDGYWVDTRAERQNGRFVEWIRDHQSENDLEGIVAIELGAGKAVPTVRMTSEQLTRLGVKLIRINPRESEVPRGQLGISGGALETLQAIDALLQRRPA